MRIRPVALLFVMAASFGAKGFDQPEVKLFVELRYGPAIVECPSVAGSLGDSLEVTLGNGMSVAMRAGTLDQEGRSAINVKILSSPLKVAHEFEYSAKLSQQKPSFQYTFPSAPPKVGIVVLVESASLLATTRDRPSWREFDTRMKPDNAFERTNSKPNCVPLLGAAQPVQREVTP